MKSNTNRSFLFLPLLLTPLWTTAQPLPSKPVLLAPGFRWTDVGLQPEFRWAQPSQSPGERFVLQVASDPQFQENLNSVVVSATSYTSQPLSPGTKHYWRLMATNAAGGASAWTSTWEFSTRGATQPAAPILISPDDNAADVIPRPFTRAFTFYWRNSSEPEDVTNEIQISRSTTFSSDDLVFTNTLIAYAGYTGQMSDEVPVSAMSTNLTCFWRVRTLNRFQPSPWSVTRSFRTASHFAPSTPLLLSPADGQFDTPINPWIAWVPSLGSYPSYIIQLSDDPTFQTLIFQTTNAYWQTFITDGTIVLEYEHRYSYRVRASNEFGTTPWASATFVTRASNTLAVPLLEWPVNGASNIDVNHGLTWRVEAASSKSTYEVLIATKPDFSDALTHRVSGTAYVPPPFALTGSEPHYWKVRVRASDGEHFSPWSSVWTFTIQPQAQAEAPVITIPSDGSTKQDTAPFVSWTWPFDGASPYTWQIQIDTSPTFSSPIWSSSGQHNWYSYGQIVPPGALSPNTTYFIRVRVANYSGTSKWSKTTTFTTWGPAPVPTPRQLSPPHESTEISRLSSFIWQAVESSPPVIYRIECASDSAFSNRVFEAETTSNYFTPRAHLHGGTTNWWRVIARNLYGESAPTPAWRFTTTQDKEYPKLAWAKIDLDVSSGDQPWWIHSKISIALDRQNRASLFYKNSDTHFTRTWFDDGNKWRTEMVDGLAPNAGGYNDAVFGPNDELVTSYCVSEGGDEDEWRATLVGTNWIKEPVYAKGGLSVGLESRLAIDSRGGLHVTSWEWNRSEVIYSSNATGSWVSEDVAPGAWHEAPIFIGPDGRPNVIYSSSTTIFHALRQADGQWVTTAVSDPLTGWREWQACQGNDGSLHVIAVVPHGYYTNDLVHYTIRDTLLERETITPIGADAEVGMVSIACGPQNDVHIAFHQLEAGALIYGTRGTNGWELYTVDSTDDTGARPRMAIGSDGSIHIAYFSGLIERVRYAVSEGARWETNAPAPPSITFPSPDATQVSTTPMLTWGGQPGPPYRKFIWQISSTASFSSVIASGMTNALKSQIGSGILRGASKYYIRVRAINDFDASEWSQVVGFTTWSSEPPVAPLSIAISGPIGAMTRFMSWAAAPGPWPVTFWLELATNSDFNSPVLVDNLSYPSTYLTEPVLQAGTTYYPRVRAMNIYGPSPWLYGDPFTIQAAQPPLAPTINSPQNGSTNRAWADTYIGWYDVSQGLQTAYKIKVADRDFQEIVFSDVTDRNGIVLPSAVLALGATYSIQVQAENKFGRSPWSASYFTVTGTAPSPVITNPRFVENTFSAKVFAIKRAVYILEYKESIADLTWIAAASVVGTGAPMTLSDSDIRAPARFYRLRIP